MDQTGEVLITVCARGGSKGIPRKNIRDLGGKPLISYSIRMAQAFGKELNARLSLSTEDSEILEVASQFDLRTGYVRPDELATDHVGKIDVLADLLRYEEAKAGIKFDYLLDLDVSSPMRRLSDLRAAFQAIRDVPDALNIFSTRPARKNPYFNMVERTSDGFVRVCKESSESFKSRQRAPEVLELDASFYIYRRKFFEDGLRTAITGRSLAYVMPHESFDLDEPGDFDYLEYLVEQGKVSLEPSP